MQLFTNKNYSVVFSETSEDKPYKVVNNRTGVIEHSDIALPRALIIADEYNYKIESIYAQALKEEGGNVVEFKPKG